MYEVPEGLTISQFKAHPVRETIMHAAILGGRAVPNRADLDALKLPPATRERVDKACREVAKTHDAGTQSDAWSRADELAVEIIGDLPAAMKDPTWWTELPPEAIHANDPVRLAALIERG